MTVLVTGATGFVGANLVRALLREGVAVRALARPTSPRLALEGLRLEVVEGDLLDPASLRRAVQGCEAVFHAGALYSFWERDPSLFYRVNVEGTASLLERAAEAGVRRVVYTSTVACVAHPPPGRLATEEDLPRPGELKDHYRRSKFLAEQKALEMARNGVPVVVVNPTAPIGPWDVKPTPTGRLLVDFLRGRMPAVISTGLNFVDVEAVARGHLLAWERGRVGRRYILGGENLTLPAFLERVGRLTGRKPPRLRLPLPLALALAWADTALEGGLLRRPPRIPLDALRHGGRPLWVDIARARQELGYEPGSLDEAIGRAVAWFREHRYI